MLRSPMILNGQLACQRHPGTPVAAVVLAGGRRHTELRIIILLKVVGSPQPLLKIFLKVLHNLPPYKFLSQARLLYLHIILKCNGQLVDPNLPLGTNILCPNSPQLRDTQILDRLWRLWRLPAVDSLYIALIVCHQQGVRHAEIHHISVTRKLYLEDVLIRLCPQVTTKANRR